MHKEPPKGEFDLADDDDGIASDALDSDAIDSDESDDGEDEEAGGPKATADILNFVDRTNEERILSEIEEVYPELAEEIRNLMFTFEDITKIDDRSIQTILKEVPRDQLVLALKTASPDLKTLLFRNISQRAAEMLKDDLDTLGPTPLKDVEKAQQAIVDVLDALEPCELVVMDVMGLVV